MNNVHENVVPWFDNLELISEPFGFSKQNCQHCDDHLGYFSHKQCKGRGQKFVSNLGGWKLKIWKMNTAGQTLDFITDPWMLTFNYESPYFWDKVLLTKFISGCRMVWDLICGYLMIIYRSRSVLRATLRFLRHLYYINKFMYCDLWRKVLSLHKSRGS